MNLVFTALSQSCDHFIPEILQAISQCECNILELRSNTSLGKSTDAAYFLVEGKWNHLAKLENSLDALQKRLGVQIQIQQTEVETATEKPYIPYRLETISIDEQNITYDIVTFLLTHHILIQEIKASCYPALYSNTPLFTTRFIVLIPDNIPLFSFRDEVLNFCDSFSLDAIFEPIKPV